MTHAFHTRTSSSSPPTSDPPLPLSSDRQELRRSALQIARSAPEPSQRASSESQPDSPSRLRESNFDWLSLGRVPVQAKPTDDAPDDQHEQEVDQVSAEVGLPDPTVQRQEEPEALEDTEALKETEKSEASETLQLKSAALSRLRGDNFDWLSLGRVPVQAKLTVGKPGDQYEQEADRVAQQVMTMPDSAVAPTLRRQEGEDEALQTKPLVASITPLVQRQSEREDDDLQAKSLEDENPLALEDETEGEQIRAKSLEQSIQREKASEGEDELDEQVVQRKSSQSPEGSAAAGGSLEQRLQGSKGGGSPLPSDVLAFMNPRFGADFSGVRVHTGGEAVQMNRDLHAQAFTHGNDVYFGAGKSAANDDLTAHELTHVVQQTGAKEGTQTQAKAMTPADSIQRLCSECEEEHPVQAKREGGSETALPVEAKVPSQSSDQPQTPVVSLQQLPSSYPSISEVSSANVQVQPYRRVRNGSGEKFRLSDDSSLLVKQIDYGSHDGSAI
jgi:hypothetical protein